jgi:signal transduction histidine kinase
VARSLLKELRPVALDELGLATALQHCVDQWRRRHPNLRCDFRAEGLPESLGEAANIALYRLVQEGLTNVTKHSGARSVRIEVQQDLAAGEVCAAVSDDGIGMDPATPRTGLGLAGLRERVEMLGGRFRVDSAPGGGTRVHAAVPLVVAGAGA